MNNTLDAICEERFVREETLFDGFKRAVLALSDRSLLTEEILDGVANGFRYENVTLPLDADEESSLRLMRTVIATVDPTFPIEGLLADYQQGSVDAWRACNDKWFEICYKRWDWCPSPSEYQ